MLRCIKAIRVGDIQYEKGKKYSLHLYTFRRLKEGQLEKHFEDVVKVAPIVSIDTKKDTKTNKKKDK